MAQDSERPPTVIHRESLDHAPSPEAVINNIEQIADSIPDAMFAAGGDELKRLVEAARRLASVAEAAYEEERNLS